MDVSVTWRTRGVEMLDITPFARAPVLQPEYRCGRVWRLHPTAEVKAFTVEACSGDYYHLLETVLRTVETT
jgi:hypothetical protein